MNRYERSQSNDIVPAFLFDPDGTLIDSVYQHVLAWREALECAGTQLSVWRIHRCIGMSGGLLVNALLREAGRSITTGQAEHSFHGITSSPKKGKSVTYVSGTICYLCVGSLIPRFHPLLSRAGVELKRSPIKRFAERAIGAQQRKLCRAQGDIRAPSAS